MASDEWRNLCDGWDEMIEPQHGPRVCVILAIVVAILSVIAFPVFAGPPVPVITGPSGGVPGDLLILDATESIADNFAWSVTPELPDGRLTILPIESGRKCIITSVPGTYSVFLAVGTADGVSIKRHVVRVASPGPDDSPEPGPGPKPPPKPKTFADSVATWTTPTPGRSDLADSFDATAAQVAAGVIRSVDELQRVSAESNRSALGVNRSAWLEWFGRLQRELKALNESGAMRTLDEHAETWRQIAAGLRRAS